MILILSLGYGSMSDLENISSQPHFVNDDQEKMVRVWNVNLSSKDDFFPTTVPTTVGPKGNIYVIKSQYSSSRMYCFDRDGTLRWRYDGINKTHQMISKPTFGKDGRIYFLHKERFKKTCTLSALNSSGHLLWNRNISNGLFRSRGPLTITGEGIYVSTSNGLIYQFDNNGNENFTQKISNYSIKVLGEIERNLYLFGSAKNKLIKTDSTGRVEWNISINSNYSLSEYSIGQSICLGLEEESPISRNCTIRSYNKDGEMISFYPLGNDTFLHSMNRNENLHFIYSDFSPTDDGGTRREKGHVVALDPTSLEYRWNFSYEYNPGEMFENLHVEEGSIYTYIWDSSYGENIVSSIFSFDSNGTLQSKLSVSSKKIKSLCIGNTGTFYGATDDANLSAFKLDRKSPVAEAGDDIITEAGEEIFLDARNSTDDTLIANYTWSVKEDNYYRSTLNYTFSNPGTYNITLRVEDKAGRENTDRITVKVKEKEDGFAPGFTLLILAIGIFVALIYTGRTKID